MFRPPWTHGLGDTLNLVKRIMAASLSPDHVFDFSEDDPAYNIEEFEEEPEEEFKEEPKEELEEKAENGA
ncbi:hypothetical protein Tco_1436883 [Tanacetum coccineum]